MDAYQSFDSFVFDELYYSRQPLMFALFFFTVHFTLRRTKFLLILIAVQFAVSTLVYRVVLDRQTQHLHVRSLLDTRRRPLDQVGHFHIDNERRAGRPNASHRAALHGTGDHHSGDGGSQHSTPAYPVHAKRSLPTPDDIDERQQQQQYEFALAVLEDLRVANAHESSGGDGGASSVKPRIVWLGNDAAMGNQSYCTLYRNTPLFGNRYVFALPDERELMLNYTQSESMHHGHYIVCENEQHLHALDMTTETTSRKRAAPDEQKRKRPALRKIQSVHMSLSFIVALQSVYSVLGIVSSWLICRLFSLPRFYRSFSFTKDYKWINYLIELGSLFASFYNVDEYIEETHFPVGIYRTFVSFLLVAFLLYYVNRTEYNVRTSYCSKTHMYNYDRCYLHWLFCSTFLMCSHFAHFVHGYYQTILVLTALVCIYALVYLFCLYEEVRTAHLKHRRYAWHALSDACTRIESCLFIGAPEPQ